MARAVRTKSALNTPSMADRVIRVSGDNTKIAMVTLGKTSLPAAERSAIQSWLSVLSIRRKPVILGGAAMNMSMRSTGSGARPGHRKNKDVKISPGTEGGIDNAVMLMTRAA